MNMERDGEFFDGEWTEVRGRRRRREYARDRFYSPPRRHLASPPRRHFTSPPRRHFHPPPRRHLASPPRRRWVERSRSPPDSRDRYRQRPRPSHQLVEYDRRDRWEGHRASTYLHHSEPSYRGNYSPQYEDVYYDPPPSKIRTYAEVARAPPQQDYPPLPATTRTAEWRGHINSPVRWERRGRATKPARWRAYPGCDRVQRRVGFAPEPSYNPAPPGRTQRKGRKPLSHIAAAVQQRRERASPPQQPPQQSEDADFPNK
ncbi:hypothetical protein GOODEAATRI_034537, partial [Goodea atripinnis]